MNTTLDKSPENIQKEPAKPTGRRYASIDDLARGESSPEFQKLYFEHKVWDSLEHGSVIFGPPGFQSSMPVVGLAVALDVAA